MPLRIDESNKVAGYKISIYKSIIFICTRNKYMNITIKNIVVFTVLQR